jgi:eukaryotic-like serine/threonine-protein kinase
MGSFLMETERLDEAERVFTQVLESNRRVRGPTHSYVGNDLENLGRLAYRRGDFARAEPYFNEALKIYRDKLSPTHAFIAMALTSLGQTQLALRRYQDAQSSLTEAVEAWRVEQGENNSGYAIASAVLARVKALQGNYTDAEPALLKTYPILTKSTRAIDREKAKEVRRWIEELYQAMGEPAAAEKYFASLAPTD